MLYNTQIDKSVIYQIYLRAFTPEGTLKGAEKMLEHIAGLGVDIVYLTPIAEADDNPDENFWSPRQKESGLNNPKNPYRIKDYYKIDEEYGSDEDLKSFVDKAHSLGLKVLLDLVYMHCGPDAVFIETNREFVKTDDNGEIVTNEYNFPLINFESDKLREYLWDNMVYFVSKFGVDGYRCDVGDAVPLDFWLEGRKRLLKIKPDIIMLNEGQKIEYVKEAFDINYSFAWSYLLIDVFKGTKPASELANLWKELNKSYTKNGKYIKTLDNHDIAHDSGDIRLEDSIGNKGIEAVSVLNFMLDGVPFIYNGYEVADDAKHSIYGNRYYGKNMVINWSNALSQKGIERLEFFRKLIKTHRSIPALYEGNVTWHNNNKSDCVLSFSRVCGIQKIFIAINTCGESVKSCIDADIKSVQNVLFNNGASYCYENQKLDIELSPMGYFVAEY